MDAHKLWMLRDFIGTNKVLFRIPVYQRNYDWSESNCNRLLDDIYGIMQSGDKHFLGTIVFMAAKSGGFALQEYIIIDGQQRLTTLMLILKALSVVAESVGDDCYHEIEEQYLHNKYCSEEFKVKLKTIKSDNNQFTLLAEFNMFNFDLNKFADTGTSGGQIPDHEVPFHISVLFELLLQEVVIGITDYIFKEVLLLNLYSFQLQLVLAQIDQILVDCLNTEIYCLGLVKLHQIPFVCQ